MTSEAAVETAARTFFERSAGCLWDEEPEQTRRGWRGDMRAALEAAAPHMLADGWDEGHDACADEMVKYDNPYRPTP